MKRLWTFKKEETTTSHEGWHTVPINGISRETEVTTTKKISSSVAVDGKTWHLARLAAATLLGAPPEDLICTIKP